jgi:predicted DNA-binding mobile mystery protein A
MSEADLAARMHVTQSSVSRLERSEKLNTARLDTLARAADAMDCDLVYAVVPRKSLAVIVNEQAERHATEQLRRLGHTMALEEQDVDDDRLRQNFELLRDNALHSRRLWSSVPSAGEPRP